MSPLDDDECQALAKEIERQRPGWLVLWGSYSKRFVAFPLFPVRRRTTLVVFYPDALVARMERPVWEYWGPLEGFGDDGDTKIPASKIIRTLASD